MSIASEVIKGYMRGIQIAYLCLQLIITLVVLLITNYIILTYGKPDRYFNIAMTVLAGLTLVIYISKIAFQLYEDHKEN